MKIINFIKKGIYYLIVLGIFSSLFFIYLKFTEKDVEEPSKSTTVYINDISDFNTKLETSNNVDMPPIQQLSEGYGLKIYNSSGDFINTKTLNITNNLPLQLYVSAINATSKNDRIGILIALDGVFQKFYVDNNKSNGNYVYETNLEMMSKINIPVTLQNDNLSSLTRLDIVMVYYLDELPGESMKFIDFYTNSISFFINEYDEKKMSNIEQIKNHNSENLYELPYRFNGKIRTNGIRNLLDIKDLNETNLTQKNSMVWDNVNQHFYFYGAGEAARYASTIFIDNNPIELGTDNVLFYELKENHIYKKDITFDNNLDKGVHSAYILTIPLDDSPFIFGSQKFIFEVN